MTIVDLEDRPALSMIGTSTRTRQGTLRGSVTLEGNGLHSAQRVGLTIRPADPYSGIVFTDGRDEVPALAPFVIDTSRGTTVGSNGFRYRTVEHLMSALAGMGVDNAVVEVSGSETPALDGSALSYVEAIDSVGVEIQDSEVREIELQEPVWVKNGESFILAVPAEEFRLTYVLNYRHPQIGCQVFSYNPNYDSFASEIAPARTFVLYEEVAGLLERELALGGNLDNVIVIWQNSISSPYRFSDELARHKAADLIGDLALAGARLKAEILAVKSGHSLNVELAKRIRQ